MNEASALIKCPNCGIDIPITEALAAPLLEQERQASAAKLQAANAAKQAAEQKLQQEQAKVEAERTNIGAEVAKRLAEQLTVGERTQREKIRSELESEIQGGKDRETEVTAHLKRAQQEAQEALKGKQQAELAAHSAKLEAQKEVQAELGKIREQAQREAQEAERLKLTEKDGQINKLLAQLDEAKRQAQQGSQQLQGEVLEVDFEAMLRQEFPWDDFEPVKAGQRGGDILHRVMSGPGIHSGTIMWEIKRTQSWGGDWTAKAKHDAAEVRAEVVIILSEATPKGIETFGFFEGVWICKHTFAIALAHAMRQQMDQVAAARRTAVGKQDKAEMLYDYLTGREFRARLEGIVEPFVQMQADLNSEKRATLTRWKKREKQIDRVLVSATSLSGDLQGIGGREMPELPAFTEQVEDELDDDE